MPPKWDLPPLSAQLQANWQAVAKVLEECFNKAKSYGDTQQANNIELIMCTIQNDNTARTAKELYADENLMNMALQQSMTDIPSIQMARLLMSDDPLRVDMSKVPGFEESVYQQYEKYINGSNHTRSEEYSKYQIANIKGKLIAKQEKRNELLKVVAGFRVKIEAWKMYGAQMQTRLNIKFQEEKERDNHRDQLKTLEDNRKRQLALKMLEKAGGTPPQQTIAHHQSPGLNFNFEGTQPRKPQLSTNNLGFSFNELKLGDSTEDLPLPIVTSDEDDSKEEEEPYDVSYVN